MSAPVDVLAVMDAEIRSLPETAALIGGSGRYTCDATEAIERLTEARAAVAELIKANHALLAAAPAHMTHRNAKEREAYRAIRAALARVGDAA